MLVIHKKNYSKLRRVREPSSLTFERTFDRPTHPRGKGEHTVQIECFNSHIQTSNDFEFLPRTSNKIVIRYLYTVSTVSYCRSEQPSSRLISRSVICTSSTCQNSQTKPRFEVFMACKCILVQVIQVMF